MFASPAPARTSHNQAVAADYGALSPVNDISAYQRLFFSAPLIAEAMNYANLPQDVRDAIWSRIDATEGAGGSQDNLALPADYPVDPYALSPTHPLGYPNNIEVTRNEAKAYYAAKVAHALYHEVHGTFPWSIASYTLDLLVMLLDSESETFFRRPQDDLDGRIGIDWTVGDTEVAALTGKLMDHSPAQAYEIAGPRWSGTTPRQAVDALLKNAFQNYIHYDASNIRWPVSVKDQWNETPIRISRNGCHTATSFMRALVQSINIPVAQIPNSYLAHGGDYTDVSKFGHSEIAFPTADVWMWHGDNVYERAEAWGADGYPRYKDYLAQVAIHPRRTQVGFEAGAALYYPREAKTPTWHVSIYVDQGWDEVLSRYQDPYSGQNYFTTPQQDGLHTLLQTLTGLDGSVGTAPARLFPVRVATTTMDHFIDQSDPYPNFMLAEDATSILGNLSPAQHEIYLSDLVSAGFNALTFHVPIAFFSDQTPAYLDRLGNSPFVSTPGYFWPNSNLAPAPAVTYWQALDTFAALAKSHQVALIVQPLYYGQSGEGWADNVVADNNSAVVIDSYVDHAQGSVSNNNAIYLFGGDVSVANMTGGTPETVEQKYRVMGEKNESFYTSSFYGQRGNLTSDYYDPSVDTWIDYRCVYGDTDAYTLAAMEYQATPTMPTILFKGRYENEAGTDAYTIRRQHWLAALNGAKAGLVYGNANINHFGAGWYSALSDPGRQQMKHLRNLLTSRNWETWQPSFDASILTSSRGTSGLDWTTVSHDGALTICAYTAAARNLTIDVLTFWGAFGDQYTAYWYDPSDGSSTYIGTYFPSLGARQFIHPGVNAAGDNDWALVLDSINAGFGAPGII